MTKPLEPTPPAGQPLPVTGGWRPGDPVGSLEFVSLNSGRPFALEFGSVLDEVTIAYETWGTLNSAGTNAVLVCHALTGDAHAASHHGRSVGEAGWWEPMIGPGRPLDTDHYFVVCANVLGGCQGSTGPLYPHPDDGRPWAARFPVTSIRDIVRSQVAVADQLGIDAWMTVVGGSMGGMQVLEWAVMFPDRVRSIAVIASAIEASPLQIAWSQVGRQAIVLDPNWNGGDYYDADPGDGPHAGLSLARKIAQIHYRSDLSYHNRFGRNEVGRIDGFSSIWDRFQIESYLDYHGSKLVRRFDANSYLVLNRAMDLHDIGRGRGGAATALRRVQVPTLIVSIDSDMLYVPRQQIELRDMMVANGTEVEFSTLHSDHGHDGFLIEFGQLGAMIDRFVAERHKAEQG